MTDNTFSLISLVAIFLGFCIAYFYGRKTKRFHWQEYFLILLVPLLLIGIRAYYNPKILKLFFGGAVVGTILEYGLGLVYEKTLNQKLWKYNRGSIGGYTSYLSIPVWGIASVVFWILGKSLGL